MAERPRSLSRVAGGPGRLGRGPGFARARGRPRRAPGRLCGVPRRGRQPARRRRGGPRRRCRPRRGHPRRPRCRPRRRAGSAPRRSAEPESPAGSRPSAEGGRCAAWPSPRSAPRQPRRWSWAPSSCSLTTMATAASRASEYALTVGEGEAIVAPYDDGGSSEVQLIASGLDPDTTYALWLSRPGRRPRRARPGGHVPARRGRHGRRPPPLRHARRRGRPSLGDEPRVRARPRHRVAPLGTQQLTYAGMRSGTMLARRATAL